MAPYGSKQSFLPLGKVRGSIEFSQVSKKRYFQYLGIPYAQPPLGKLRFAKPVAAKGWGEDVRDGTLAPPICPQPDPMALYDDSYDDPRVEDDRLIRLSHIPVIGQEDCLVLNVYRPGTD